MDVNFGLNDVGNTRPRNKTSANQKREKWKKHILALITGLAWECCFGTEAARRVGTSQFEIPPATILGYFE